MRGWGRAAEELRRLGKILQEMRLGPTAPGEVRCGREHGAGPEQTHPVPDLLRGGCPGCGAQL